MSAGRAVIADAAEEFAWYVGQEQVGDVLVAANGQMGSALFGIRLGSESARRKPLRLSPGGMIRSSKASRVEDPANAVVAAPLR